MTPQEQYILRKWIVNLHSKGFSNADIVHITDAKLRHVQSTIKKYKDGGLDAISLKKMGRPISSNKKLSPDQEEKLKAVFTSKTPDDYGLYGFLWDMRNVLAVIMILFQLSIPRSTMSVYFKRWGYTPQRPIIRSYKQNPAHIKNWLEVEYPKIKERAKNENAEIFWGDETGVQNKCNYAKGYAPKGKTPVAVLSTEQKIRVNMMSAINNQGKLRFMTYEGKMNQQRLIIFAKRLVKTAPKKVFLILDNLSVHHGKIFKAWLAENKDKIEVFYLPPYAPEYNPDEYFNGTLKREVEKLGNAAKKETLMSNVRSSARKIQSDKELVKSLFNKKETVYAAA
jgi:transposase